MHDVLMFLLMPSVKVGLLLDISSINSVIILNKSAIAVKSI